MSSTYEHTPEGWRPIGEILSRVGDRWTGLLLQALGDRRMRFNELHRAIEGISQRMLRRPSRGIQPNVRGRNLRWPGQARP